MDDAALLQRYAADRSEPAFSELVRRHVDLVYSAALRQTGGDPHRAQEVTQMVFISLARKAVSLSRHPSLLAWLHQSTWFAAGNLRRDEGRRRARETAAAAEQDLAEGSGPLADWGRVRPVLDEAVNDLPPFDREAVLLRFFANRPFGEVGRQLGLSENAARMRVERALGKLQEALRRRGITSTAVALGAALAGNAVVAAPPGLAATATGMALSAGAGGGGVFRYLMSSIKVQVGIASVLLAAGSTGVLLQHRAEVRLQREIDRVGRESGLGDLGQGLQHIGTLRTENRRLAESATAVRALQAAAADVVRLRGEARDLAARKASNEAGAARGPVSAPPGVYQPSQLDQQPVGVLMAHPVYPVAMKASGMEGQAVVEFIVQADGSVADAKTLTASDPAFADAAVAAVQHWQFKAGLVGGSPVGTRVRVPVNFQISSDGGKWF